MAGVRPPGRAGPRTKGGLNRGAVAGLAGCALLLIAAVLAGSLLAQQAFASLSRRLRPPPTPRPPNIAALGAGPVVGPPTLELAQIEQILRDYGSPATGDAASFYDLGLQYGIDPAYALAFFVVESRAGTRGVAMTTRSIGNLRALSGEPAFEGYRLYDSWHEGIEDWYRLIARIYVDKWGLTTVDAIVPVYAPDTDSNDPAAYTRAVKTLIARWRGL